MGRTYRLSSPPRNVYHIDLESSWSAIQLFLNQNPQARNALSMNDIPEIGSERQVLKAMA